MTTEIGEWREWYVSRKEVVHVAVLKAHDIVFFKCVFNKVVSE